MKRKHAEASQISARMAFVGLGAMGQAMSTRLVDHGDLEQPLLLFNRTYDVAESHARSIRNARAVKSLPAVIEQSDIIWSCLADDEAVRAIFAEIDGKSVKGKLFVECSTVSAETTEEVRRILDQAGADFISMPVFGEPSTATAGMLVVVPAGPAHGIDRIRPLLVGVIASAVVDFPDEAPEKANVLKLLGNVLIMTTMEQVAELLVFAEKANLGTDAIEKLLAALYPGGPRQHSKYASLMVSGAYHQRKAIVGTETAVKLSEKVLTLAKSLDVQLKGYEVAIGHLKEAQKVAGPNSDIIGVYGVVRQESGLDFKI